MTMKAPGELVKASAVIKNTGVAYTDRLSFTFGQYKGDIFTPAPFDVVSAQMYMTASEWQAELGWYDQMIAYYTGLGHPHTAAIYQARREACAQFKQYGDFVLIGDPSAEEPNREAEAALYTPAGNKACKSAMCQGSLTTDFIIPGGEHEAKFAFTTYPGSRGGEFDVLVELEGQRASHVSEKAFQLPSGAYLVTATAAGEVIQGDRFPATGRVHLPQSSYVYALSFWILANRDFYGTKWFEQPSEGDYDFAINVRTENRYGYTGIKIGDSYYVPKGVWPIYSDCIIIIQGDESDESLPVWSSIDTGLRIVVV
ncbi:MAG TPA: hypothetical protein DIT43_01845 [Dehalococcoidia bacterium]|nr:hypothetical protein [Dehalococcoidia bacterium]